MGWKSFLIEFSLFDDATWLQLRLLALLPKSEGSIVALFRNAQIIADSWTSIFWNPIYFEQFFISLGMFSLLNSNSKILWLELLRKKIGYAGSLPDGTLNQGSNAVSNVRIASTNVASLFGVPKSTLSTWNKKEKIFQSYKSGPGSKRVKLKNMKHLTKD